MALFAVFGLGSFGGALALELARLKHDVIGIDLVKRNVENIADKITHAVIADATDEHILEELNVQNCDSVVVAIGENIEASILCVLHLKNLGVNKILAKAKTKSHHMILSHLNIHKIIHPEEDMGVRIAQTLTYPMVSRYMALSHNHYIIKIHIPKNLNQINLYGILNKHPHVRFVLLQRQKQMIYQISHEQLLSTEDILILEGELEALKKISNQFV